ncbi:hypothetical protein [Flavobacterium granuli]|nr:hypothetical protein [Flavobacterium granuli]
MSGYIVIEDKTKILSLQSLAKTDVLQIMNFKNTGKGNFKVIVVPNPVN